MKIVIFGASEIGCLIATEFFEDHDITIIDKDENKTGVLDRLDIIYIAGNGSNINTLKSANIDDADIFIACSCFDEANIVACLTVSRLSDAKTVCFVSKPEYIESLTFSELLPFLRLLMLNILHRAKQDSLNTE